jgi:hypothetical protein
MFLRYIPVRFQNSLRAARHAFNTYQAKDYNGNIKVYRFRQCEHCGKPWSTFHCDLYLCEGCVEDYGDDYFTYKARRVPYIQALARLEHQRKWYELSQDDLDTHWWIMGSVWNCPDHWAYFLELIREVKDQPEAIIYFAQHDLNLPLAWERYQRFDPTGHTGRRIRRRHIRQEALIVAVDETLQKLRRNDMYGSYAPGEEFTWWDIKDDTAEWDFDYQLYQFCEEHCLWFDGDFEDFTWSQFVDAFWEMYPNLFATDLFSDYDCHDATAFFHAP